MNAPWLRCAISDRNAGAPGGRTRLLRQAARLAAEGIDLLQLREKDLLAAELASVARDLLETLSEGPTKLLINHRADVAVAVGAPGVHLTSEIEELRPRQVYRLYEEAGLPPPLVTVSCHTLEEVSRIAAEPLLAILFGPVFEKSVAGEHLADGGGIALLREACALAGPVPVLALGGVTTANMGACRGAGARGVAGIRLFQRM